MQPSIPDMIAKNDRNSTWFEWYYRAFAPPAAPANASLIERELSRRGRLSSVLLLFGFLATLMMLPVAFGPNKALLPILLSGLVLSACSLVINKMGHTSMAGILCVLCTETCLLSAVVTMPTGLTLFSLPLLDVLIVPEVIAVSLLAPWSVFIIAATNSVSCIGFFIFLHRDAVLDAVIKTQGYDTLLRPIMIQFVVAVVTYLWMQRTKRVIQLADRTEVIASLQSDLLGAQSENQRCKRELDRVIAVLEDAQNRIARGDLSVRIPLEGEILSSIGGKFNNLINRFQRALKSESDLMYLQQAINYIVSEVDVARERGGPFQLRRTGTQLDSLLLAFLVLQQNQETASKTLNPNPASVHNHRSITRNLNPTSSNPEAYNSGAYNPVTPMPPIPATNRRSDWQSGNQKQSKTSPFRLRSLYPSPLQMDK
jgi:hypothetical protein